MKPDLNPARSCLMVTTRIALVVTTLWLAGTRAAVAQIVSSSRACHPETSHLSLSGSIDITGTNEDFLATDLKTGFSPHGPGGAISIEAKGGETWSVRVETGVDWLRVDEHLGYNGGWPPSTVSASTESQRRLTVGLVRRSGRARVICPYAVIGAGLYQHSLNGARSTNGGAFVAAGLESLITARLAVFGEVQLHAIDTRYRLPVHSALLLSASATIGLKVHF
jgi:hypothetical protein